MLLVPHRQYLERSKAVYEWLWRAPDRRAQYRWLVTRVGAMRWWGCWCVQLEWFGSDRARLGLPVPSQVADLCNPGEGPSH